MPEENETAEDVLAPETHDIDERGTSTKIPWVGFDGRIELLDSDDPIFEETLSETSEDETMPEVYVITDGCFEEAANLMLTLCQQNETKKHGKSSEIQRHPSSDMVHCGGNLQRLESLAITGNNEYQCGRNPGRKL